MQNLSEHLGILDINIVATMYLLEIMKIVEKLQKLILINNLQINQYFVVNIKTILAFFTNIVLLI